VGQEVAATTDDVRPTEVPAPGGPETGDLRPEDSTSAFVRNTAVMAVGTSLSRLTGFLRIAAMAFALGITETRLADAYNTANVTPNLVYELVLGGVLSSVLVPVFVEWMQRRGAEASWGRERLFTLAFITLTAITIVTIVAAPWIVARDGAVPMSGDA
jgi:putative peptidoglycan lipid II flippase